VSQTVRVGPQDAKKVVFLKPGDLLEVALPEKNVIGAWRVDFDPTILWDGVDAHGKARWVLGETEQSSLRTFQALTQGTSVLYFEYMKKRNGSDEVLDTVYFEININPNPPSKAQAAKKTAAKPPPRPIRPPEQKYDAYDYEYEDTSELLPETDRAQKLEEENRKLQERLWSLTDKLVKLTEDYARFVGHGKKSSH
jgi:hypothetical protein